MRLELLYPGEKGYQPGVHLRGLFLRRCDVLQLLEMEPLSLPCLYKKISDDIGGAVLHIFVVCKGAAVLASACTRRKASGREIGGLAGPLGGGFDDFGFGGGLFGDGHAEYTMREIDERGEMGICDSCERHACKVRREKELLYRYSEFGTQLIDVIDLESIMIMKTLKLS